MKNEIEIENVSNLNLLKVDDALMRRMLNSKLKKIYSYFILIIYF